MAAALPLAAAYGVPCVDLAGRLHTGAAFTLCGFLHIGRSCGVPPEMANAFLRDLQLEEAVAQRGDAYVVVRDPLTITVRSAR